MLVWFMGVPLSGRDVIMAWGNWGLRGESAL